MFSLPFLADPKSAVVLRSFDFPDQINAAGPFNRLTS